MRASTALATRNDAYSEAVRTKMSLPTRASGRMSSVRGRRVVAGARKSSAANAAPMPACAITVPHADPASPHPNT
jgi:hypothetical protein